MPAKRKAANMPPRSAPASKKAYAMAPTLPEGEVLEDFRRKRWRLAKSFAVGGFGRIYHAKSLDPDVKGKYVVKIEPAENGPLFQEFHVYNRILKPNMIESYKVANGLEFLGVPAFYGAGLLEKSGFKYRFLILPRFGPDLEKIRESRPGGNFAAEPSSVFRLAETCLNAYEYLHRHMTVHADLKAENLLLADGAEPTDLWNCYLVDYGLAKRIAENPVYKEQPKKAHDGTLIFTSLDAHKGCSPSYRGDIEILAYNIVFWLSGSLPWLRESPDKVLDRKLRFSQNVRRELLDLFGMQWPYLTGMVRLFAYAYNEIAYEQKPDFDQLRSIVSAMTKTVAKSRAKDRRSLDENTAVATRSPSKKRLAKGGRAAISDVPVRDDSIDSDRDLFDPRPKPSPRSKYVPPRVDETADSSSADSDLAEEASKYSGRGRGDQALSSRSTRPRPVYEFSSDDADAASTKVSGVANFRRKPPTRKCVGGIDKPTNRRLSTLEASLLNKYRNPKPTSGNLSRDYSTKLSTPTAENGTQTSPRLSERWLAGRRAKRTES